MGQHSRGVHMGVPPSPALYQPPTQSLPLRPSTKPTGGHATEMNIRDAVLALLLTEVVEVAVAVFLGYRRPKEIIAVILVNLLTNPSLNFLLFLNDYYGVVQRGWPLILLLEAAVILIEWALLVFALHENQKSLLGLSFVMNTCSYLTGVLIFGS